MKKTLSRIFAVLLVVSMLFTQLLVPVSAEVKNCECDPATRKGVKTRSVAATCGYFGYDMYKCNSCKGLYTIYTDEPTGAHTYVDHPAKAETCTEIGYGAYQTCEDCDFTSYDATTEVPALGHDMAVIPAQDATCTQIGWAEYEDCTRCDYTVGYEPIEKLPHTPADPVDENPIGSTCTTPATVDKVVYCGVCGEKMSSETVETAPEEGHDYVVIDSKDPICKPREDATDGYITYECTKCGDTYTVTLPAPEEHNYVLTEQKPDCEVDGFEIHTCTVCDYENEVAVPATGHTEETIKGYAATCEETGLTDGKKCTVCGKITKAQTVIPAKGHTYAKDDEGTVIAPTCKEEGYTTKYCTVCKNDIVQDGSIVAIDPLNHVKSHVVSAYVAPTCTEVGYTEGLECDECGKTTKRVEEIPALGHNIKNIAAKDPTCTEIGWDAYEKCTRCDYTTYVEKAALGHKLNPTIGHKDATCEVESYDFQYCLVCGEQVKSNFGADALGHNWSAWTAVDADTHTRTCQNAECDVVGGKVETAEHNIVEHEAKEPTCTEVGWDAYVTCEDCDYTTYVEKAALGHRNERWVAQEATCTQDGWSDHIKCARCGEATPHSYTPALGHRIMNVPDKAPSCFEAGWTKHTECARCGETSPYFVIAPYGEHGEVVIDEAVQPTFDETGLTEGSHCGRCNEVLVPQIVIDRVKEDVSFTYEATGLNGSEYTVNSGYVTLNVYMNVNSTAARLWGADLTLNFDSNLTLTAVDGCAFEYANNSDVLNNSIKLAQGMNVGSNFKTFEMGQYLFATLTFKVDKDFYSANAMFEIVADECNLVRRDIENNTDFSNELVVDFGTGTEIYVAQLGDANADGKFSSVDTMSLAQWFASADIGAYEAVYDMNKDGYIDGDDFAILRGAVVRDYSYLED